MREASAERDKALLPAVRVLLSTHALCQKKNSILFATVSSTLAE